MRSSLARKIGKEECAFAAKWRRLRLIQHQFVWINSECSRGCNKILAHCIAPPTQTSACGKSDAHQVPTIWNRMTKRMENSMGSWPPLVCCGKDHTTRSHCASDRSLCDDSRSNSLRSLIACARNNNCSHWKSRCLRALGMYARAGRSRFEKLWKQSRVDGKCRAHLRRPAAIFAVKQQRSRSVGHIGMNRSSQSKSDIVLRQHDPFRDSHCF